MLTQIKLTNFKCFKQETTFPLSRFNLLTGVNGSGKSTLLQSLLLMRQSIEHDQYTTQLILNGSGVNLGSFDDVRHHEISAMEPIFLEFSINNAKVGGTIGYRLERKNDDLSLHIPEMIIQQRFFSSSPDMPPIEKDYCLRYLREELYQLQEVDRKRPCLFRLLKLAPIHFNLRTHEHESGPDPLIVDRPSSTLTPVPEWGLREDDYIGFEGNKDGDNLIFEKSHYISADRIGPQELYEKAVLPKFVHVDAIGKFTVNLLDKMRDELVNEKLCLGEDARTLITQTEAWLGQILGPLKLEVLPLTRNTLELRLGGHKPANVGFGYSNILPIIVSGLIAKPEEKLIIENPEIHLHPKAQTALIQFLVAVAKTGVQVFVESHSDHVLNALRIAVFEKQLTPENLSILYFQSNITSILVDEKGKLRQKTADGTTARIPKGFFDEWTNSMAKLF